MNKKFVLIGVIAFVVISTILLFYVGNYFYNLAINPNSPKKAAFGSSGGSPRELTEDEKWLKEKSQAEDVYIKSFDGLKLHAYQVLSDTKSHKWAITVHGYMSNPFSLSTKALHYYDKGYNVLSIDLRGHSKSEGDYVGMGFHDSKDVLKWIEYIVSKDEKSEILLHGVSMGGATVMLTSGYDLVPNVKVIVEDCGYSSALEQFEYQLKKLYNIPSFPILNMANLVVKLRAGYFFTEASPIESVAKAKVPIIFIHGDEDEFVPYYMLDKVYDACSSPKKKVVIKGATHSVAERKNPRKYWREIDNFIQNYI